jgi:hypothetical protein
MLQDSEIFESRSLTDIVQSLDWTTVDYGDDVRDFPFLDSTVDACPQLLDSETCCPQGAQLMQMAFAAGVVTSITPTAVPEPPEVDLSFQPLVVPLINQQQLLQQQQQLMNCRRTACWSMSTLTLLLLLLVIPSSCSEVRSWIVALTII